MMEMKYIVCFYTLLIFAVYACPSSKRNPTEKGTEEKNTAEPIVEPSIEPIVTTPETTLTILTNGTTESPDPLVSISSSKPSGSKLSTKPSKVTTESSEPTTNPTMKTTTQVTTTTKTTPTTTRKPTTPRKFEFGKINKITTKTHDSDKAAMGKHGRLYISICGSQSLSSCCFIEPLAIKSGSNVQVSYKRNEVDVFKGRSLRQCEGVQFKQIKRLKIRNLLYKEGNRPDGWQGDYIDIGFHNGTSFHCDLTEWGMIQDVTRSVQDSCTLKNNAKRSHHNFEKKSFSNDDQNE